MYKNQKVNRTPLQADLLDKRRLNSNHLCLWHSMCNQIHEPDINAWRCELETPGCIIWRLKLQRGGIEFTCTLSCQPVRQRQPDITFWTCPFWLVWSSLIHQSRHRIFRPIRKEKNESVKRSVWLNMLHSYHDKLPEGKSKPSSSFSTFTSVWPVWLIMHWLCYVFCVVSYHIWCCYSASSTCTQVHL